MNGLAWAMVGFAAVTAIAFAAMVLVTSHLRYEALLRRSKDPGEPFDPRQRLRLFVARRIRFLGSGTPPFCMVLVSKPGAGAEDMEALAARLRRRVRATDDHLVVGESGVALLLGMEGRYLPVVLERIGLGSPTGAEAADGWRAGAGVYPDDGTGAESLCRTAESALAAALASADRTWARAGGAEPAAPAAGTAPDDPLAGIFREDQLGGALRKYCAYLRRIGGHPVFVLFCPYHPGDVMGRHGEAAVDEQLRGLVRLLEKDLRSGDLISRAPGRSIAVVLDGGVEPARLTVERLLEKIRTLHVPIGQVPVPLAFSVGMAAMPDHARTVPDLFRAAELAARAAASVPNFYKIYQPVFESLFARPEEKATDSF